MNEGLTPDFHVTRSVRSAPWEMDKGDGLNSDVWTVMDEEGANYDVMMCDQFAKDLALKN